MTTTRRLRRHRVALAGLAAAVSVGCASAPDLGQPVPEPDITAQETSPTATEEPPPQPARPGSGALDLDDAVIEVRGDCDLSRGFGREDPLDLDGHVDLVLEVRDALDQPFAVRVRLVGGGSVLGRTLVVVGGAGADPTSPPRWEGTVTEAGVRAHPTGDPRTVVLDLVAASDPDDDASRQVRLTVDCAVTQPG